MKTTRLVLVGLLLAGCARAPEADEADAYLVALETLDLDPGRDESRQAYCDRVYGSMEAGLARIDDPEALREVFWRCHAVWSEPRETSQERLQWIDPHPASLELVMYRLADLKTDAAAKVLVDLYVDPRAGWDAHAAEMAGDAVVRCGKPALPHLRRASRAGRNAARLVELIESGATSGF